MSCCDIHSVREENMFHMASRRALVVAGLAAILTAPLAWSQDAPPVRVRGTIERTEGPVFVVKSRDGTELKILLADNAVAVGVVKASIEKSSRARSWVSPRCRSRMVPNEPWRS